MEIIKKIKKKFFKPKLLLHICCVGCGVYVLKVLQKDYKVIFLFYNPNIYPDAEYASRLNEAKKLSKKFRIKLIEYKDSYQNWLSLVKYENR